MKAVLLLGALIAVLCSCEKSKQKVAGSNHQKQIVITIDDLPLVDADDEAVRRRVTENILAALRHHNAPVIGFVNEKQLGNPVNPAELSLLAAWLKAGAELGNHTYSHVSYTKAGLAKYEREIVKGEAHLRPLMRSYGKTLRYFRHPYLVTGATKLQKEALEHYLSSMKYKVAPVTAICADWEFAEAYDKLSERSQNERATIIDKYLDYCVKEVEFSDGYAHELFGRDIPGILLLHANQLNGVALSALLDRLNARGYQFVSLDQALADPAYATAASYYGDKGIGWLQRWALTLGKPQKWGPARPPLN